MPRQSSTALAAVLLALSAGGCGGADEPAGGRDAGPDAGVARAELRGSSGGAPESTAAVRPGVEVLIGDSLHLVRGRRVGLVTNHTGIDASGISSIDRLSEHPEVELVALYSPEHGIRGEAEAGVLVGDTLDAATGLPVHSLYGETRKPTPAMLDGVEVLLFDIQDIGTRYFTYVYTMSLAMEAAGEEGIPFVVLDRPNPIGGEAVHGNVLEPEHASFVGLHPLPMRHGMTPGELARLFRDAHGVEVELHVAPLDGWRRAALFFETGLPWIAPSPNMPDLESALHYPGTCLFEGTNLSVGRGTERAFQQVGAPWLDGEELARRMSARGLPGVEFEAVRFTPRNPGDGKFADEEVGGVRLRVTDPERYDPAATGVALLVEARRVAGNRWEWNVSHFDRLAGTEALRRGIEEGLDADELTAGWEEELEAFERAREGALIYR